MFQGCQWAVVGDTFPLGCRFSDTIVYPELFAENPDRVLSRQDLIAGLGKQDPPIDERTVDVWVGRLRRALQAAGAGQPLRTVRSMGYVYDSA